MIVYCNSTEKEGHNLEKNNFVNNIFQSFESNTMISLKAILFFVSFYSFCSFPIFSHFRQRRTTFFMAKTVKMDPSASTDVCENMTLRFQSLIEKEPALFFSYEKSNQHTYIVPKQFQNISSNDIWNWWQTRKSAEKLLKKSIASNEVFPPPYEIQL